MAKDDIVSVRRDFLRLTASGAALLVANPLTSSAGAADISPGVADESPPYGILGPKVKIQHVAFNVKDLEASVAWWKEKLGFKEYVRVGLPPNSTMVLVRSGDIFIELTNGSKAAAPITKGGSVTTGYLHTSFVVGDAAAVRQRLEDRGVKTSKPGDGGGHTHR